jgi:hypothetical protein
VSGEVVQWGRRVRVVLETGGTAVLVADARPDARPEDVGLRVSFSVQKHLLLEPQKCRLTIWGLSRERRDDLTRVQDEALALAWKTRSARNVGRLRIDAGRPGSFGPLFVGQLQQVTHARDGAGWRTDVDALDGRMQWKEAYVSQTVVPGVDLSTIQDVLAASENVLMGKQPLAAFAERFGELAQVQGVYGPEQGFVLQGPSKDCNQALLDVLGLDAFWADGQLKFVPRGRVLSDPAVELVREETLLSETRAERGYSNAVAFLDPLLQPARQVQLREQDGRPIRALAHRVEAVTWDASTWDRAWYSRLVLRPSARLPGDAGGP